MIREVELLAPAKNADIGIEAINHGADAVYIGAAMFSARAAAGNSIEDIERLVKHAHFYNARVYVALNTVLTDDQLPEAEKLIWQLYEKGVDALIVQDMGILELNLPPIELHASTQTDNRDPEKALFLAKAGFSQVVLARELDLTQINSVYKALCSYKAEDNENGSSDYKNDANINQQDLSKLNKQKPEAAVSGENHNKEVALEAFVHGALCVCYSGQCYISEALSGRSANRGNCAQYCRLPYNLYDGNGRLLQKDKHLLSLKDLNQSDYLEQMIDAGVTSLKIEGRLKDEAYVKNITAYYRKRIDAILKRRNDLKRKSSGKCSFTFEPNPDKSFSRGFTNYFLKGRGKEPVYSPETPKSKGEFVGTVKELKKGFFTVAGLTPVHNGDGLCFVNEEGVLQGFRVNKVEENKVFPLEQPVLKPKTRLFRNYDHEFEKQLAKESSQRKISVSMKLESVENGFTLYVEDEDGNHVTQFAESAKETARSEQKENQIRQLSKLGGTPYEVSGVDICFDEPYFIPSSLLADLRREAIAELTEERVKNYHRNEVKHTKTSHSFVTDKLTYLGNVTNSRARSFYSQHGVEKIDNGFELEKPDSVALMFTKHCVKYAMGWCRKYQNVKESPAEPLTLEYKGQKLRLEFDCRNCEMKIYKHL